MKEQIKAKVKGSFRRHLSLKNPTITGPVVKISIKNNAMENKLSKQSMQTSLLDTLVVYKKKCNFFKKADILTFVLFNEVKVTFIVNSSIMTPNTITSTMS